MHGKPGGRLGRLFANAFQDRRVFNSEAAGDAPGRRAGRCRHQQKTDAAMDGKDATVVVDADQRIEVATGQEQPTQRRAAVIRGEAGRQHEADASAVAGERDRALQEQLIPVRMTARLRVVDAGIAREPEHRRDIAPGVRANVRVAGVGPNHVPRRVADDRVEPGRWQPRAVAVEKYLREFELPVEKLLSGRDVVDRGEKTIASAPPAANRVP